MTEDLDPYNSALAPVWPVVSVTAFIVFIFVYVIIHALVSRGISSLVGNAGFALSCGILAFQVIINIRRKFTKFIDRKLIKLLFPIAFPSILDFGIIAVMAVPFYFLGPAR
ncbi:MULTISPECIES: hypothetical protein [unclassified Frankia]|uniref:hypothetical protein n=1 Tax=unclassified Frankia TaxID=2632575 RepID=UPI002AD27686|nr:MULTISPECIES: hypothetical protein [unclassified Frankia]